MIYKPCYICSSGREEHTVVLRQGLADAYLSLIDGRLNELHPERAITGCRRCGFLFHAPTLTDDELKILYERFRDRTFRNETPDEYFDRITSFPKEQSFNYKKTMRLNALMREYLPPRTERAIYDVGAGGGVFLKTFLDHAEGQWTAYGCEPTPSYADLARRRLGIDVLTRFYEPGLFDRQFDLITAIKVIEHAQDPITFLKGLRQDLSDDGMVWVEVPSCKEIVRLPPDHDQLLYTHLYFLSAPVLEYMCETAGFRIVWLEEPESPNGEVDLLAVLKKRPDGEAGKEFRFPLYDLKEL